MILITIALLFLPVFLTPFDNAFDRAYIYTIQGGIYSALRYSSAGLFHASKFLSPDDFLKISLCLVQQFRIFQSFPLADEFISAGLMLQSAMLNFNKAENLQLQQGTRQSVRSHAFLLEG